MYIYILHAAVALDCVDFRSEKIEVRHVYCLHPYRTIPFVTADRKLD